MSDPLTQESPIDYLEKALQLLGSVVNIVIRRKDIKKKLICFVGQMTLPLLLIENSLVLLRLFNFFTFSCDYLYTKNTESIRSMVYYAFSFLGKIATE